MLETLLPFTLFALSSTLTPGPNNVMLLASGANFGLRATGPHMLGISIGFPVMVFAIGLGLGAVFEQFPELHEILRWAGGAQAEIRAGGQQHHIVRPRRQGRRQGEEGEGQQAFRHGLFERW